MMRQFLWIVFAVLGYLLGSILFSKIITAKACHKDICTLSDDGNPGAANAYRQCGWQIGGLCLVLDILKGFVPVFLASLLLGIDSLGLPLVMLAPVLGHAFPFYTKGQNGGKCIAVSFGVLTGLLWKAPLLLVVLGILFITFAYILKIQNGRLRAVIVYIIFILIAVPLELYLQQPMVAAGCILISLTSIYKHLPLSPNTPRHSKKKGPLLVNKK